MRQVLVVSSLNSTLLLVPGSHLKDFLSVQFCCSVMSDSLRSHGLQHTRFPCPSPTPPTHQPPEFTQTHVYTVGNAIQPSHPLLSPSPPAFNLSQNQGLFKWVSSSHQVAKVLEFQLQHQSFQWMFRTDFLGGTGWISLLSKRFLKLLVIFRIKGLQACWLLAPGMLKINVYFFNKNIKLSI